MRRGQDKGSGTRSARKDSETAPEIPTAIIRRALHVFAFFPLCLSLSLPQRKKLESIRVVGDLPRTKTKTFVTLFQMLQDSA